MDRPAADNISKILGCVAAAFGVIALILCCVGFGTIRWYIDGTTGSNYVASTANFLSLCNYAPSTGDTISCKDRSGD
ncbi:hypothetical protein I4U23_027558 [Adineta vaga]|nr:hypothetical protein I4U23_027558 [Adineta vaga]